MALIPESEARRIAVAAGADTKTVKRYIAGEVVRPLTAQRVRAALLSLGLDELLPRTTGEARRMRR